MLPNNMSKKQHMVQMVVGVIDILRRGSGDRGKGIVQGNMGELEHQLGFESAYINLY